MRKDNTSSSDGGGGDNNKSRNIANTKDANDELATPSAVLEKLYQMMDIVRIQWESQKAYNRQPRPIYHGMDI